MIDFSSLRALNRHASISVLEQSKRRRVWLDVGAHLGEYTFPRAAEDASLSVYAFEPNIAIASQRFGVLPNYVMLPLAISEQDGFAEFHINAYTMASSLLPFNPTGLANWIGGEKKRVEQKVQVPTIRLDTFLNRMGIAKVEYLKIDAQGADLAVIRSAGARLIDFRRISLEVQLTEIPLYEGASEKNAVIDHLFAAGFRLVSVERQSHDQEENLTFERVGPGKARMGDLRELEGAVEGSPTRIVTPEGTWSYAAAIPLTIPAAITAEIWVRIKATVLRGEAGFGLLNGAGTAFQDRSFLAAGSEAGMIYLEIADAADLAYLIIENSTPDGSRAEILLEEVTALILPG